MRILFLGDSITEGVPGVSYVDIIKEEYQNWDIVNRGKGGDTARSLYKRILKMNDLEQFDKIFLFVGVNDVFGRISIPYKIIKVITRQKSAKTIQLFERHYETLIQKLLEVNNDIVVIPPLLIGEDYNNRWNKEVKSLVDIVGKYVRQYSICYLDLYNEFRSYITKKSPSDYLPMKVSELLKDVKSLTSTEMIDSKSKQRKLHLTLDGVHINSKGASMISKMIIEYINRNNT